MKINVRVWQRAGYTIAALAFVVLAAYPALQPALASAAQLSSRSITLSDSGPSGGTITSGVGSGTAVTYKVKFTSTTAAQSMVIDFCSQDPILGTTCTGPTGMNVGSAVLNGVTGSITGTGWTVSTVTSGGLQTVKLAKGSGSTASAGVQEFELSGITNPSTTGTFYARMYTYADTSFGSTTTAYASPTTLGDYKDYGGIALSTNRIITITARVQEQLTFCVSGADPTTWTGTQDCNSTEAATPPAVTLGHGSPTAVLEATATDTQSVYSEISTNATAGAVIALRNSNLVCGGLSADYNPTLNTGTCAIAAINSGAGTSTTIANGDGVFGLHVDNGVAGAGGSGTVTADTNYNGGASTYGMDTETTTDTGSVIGAYGDRVAYCTAPVYRMDNTYTFAATASLTTPAGIYTANMDLIATGTF